MKNGTEDKIILSIIKRGELLYPGFLNRVRHFSILEKDIGGGLKGFCEGFYGEYFKKLLGPNGEAITAFCFERGGLPYREELVLKIYFITREREFLTEFIHAFNNALSGGCEGAVEFGVIRDIKFLESAKKTACYITAQLFDYESGYANKGDLVSEKDLSELAARMGELSFAKGLYRQGEKGK